MVDEEDDDFDTLLWLSPGKAGRNGPGRVLPIGPPEGNQAEDKPQNPGFSDGRLFINTCSKVDEGRPAPCILPLLAFLRRKRAPEGTGPVEERQDDLRTKSQAIDAFSLLIRWLGVSTGSPGVAQTPKNLGLGQCTLTNGEDSGIRLVRGADITICPPDTWRHDDA
jgi:hypothetical protein